MMFLFFVCFHCSFVVVVVYDLVVYCSVRMLLCSFIFVYNLLFLAV